MVSRSFFYMLHMYRYPVSSTACPVVLRVDAVVILPGTCMHYCSNCSQSMRAGVGSDVRTRDSAKALRIQAIRKGCPPLQLDEDYQWHMHACLTWGCRASVDGMMGHEYGVLVAVLVMQWGCALWRAVMASWLHGVLMSVC